MRVLVIGGRGYLGGVAAEALRKRARCEVVVGSRSASGAGTARIDLADSSTFGAAAGFDAVVNCSDSVSARPDAFVRHALAAGLLVIEATADPLTAAALLNEHRPERVLTERGARGTVLLGAGIFPGLSNLLAHEVKRRFGEEGAGGGEPDTLEFFVRLTPFAGAGRGTVRLMTDLFRGPAVRYEHGEAVGDRPIEHGRPARFDATRKMSPTLRVGLPESVMMHFSTGVKTTASHLALRPSFGQSLAPLMARVIGTADAAGPGPVRRCALWGMDLGLRGVRSVALRSRREKIELAACARREAAGDGGAVWAGLSTDDGFACAGEAIAAITTCAAGKGTLPRGLVLVDEVMGLEEVLSGLGSEAGVQAW